jgi:uncharacterized protein (TIGR03085 family)
VAQWSPGAVPAGGARHERLRLAHALSDAGPDAPTLCAGWTALDLAAHVVAREYRPDTLPGLVGGPLRGWTERVRRRAAEEGLPVLVSRLRVGPPPWSPFALPGVDPRANLLEYLVHHEDVRRAEGAGPRDPVDAPPDLQDDVWQALLRTARPLLRRVDGPVLLRRTDLPARGPGHRFGADGEAAVLAGPPIEVALYVFGRRAVAQVSVEGPPTARRRLETADLRV